MSDKELEVLFNEMVDKLGYFTTQVIGIIDDEDDNDKVKLEKIKFACELMASLAKELKV